MADATGALQDKIRAARQRKQNDVEIRVSLPEWPGLVGVYQPIDWRKRVDLQRDLLVSEDAEIADRVYNIAVSSLLAASKTVEAVDEGVTLDLGFPLGVELATWLDINATQNGEPLALVPDEALSLIVEDKGDLIAHFEQVTDKLETAEKAVDKSIVGKSDAVS